MGPSSNKFSFAFKTSSKTSRPTSGPNPEIEKKLDRTVGRSGEGGEGRRIDPASNSLRHIPTAPRGRRDWRDDRRYAPRDERVIHRDDRRGDYRDVYPPREPRGERGEHRDLRELLPRRDVREPPREPAGHRDREFRDRDMRDRDPRIPTEPRKVKDLIRDYPPRDRDPRSHPRSRSPRRDPRESGRVTPRDAIRDAPRGPVAARDSRASTPRPPPREPPKELPRSPAPPRPSPKPQPKIIRVKKTIRRIKEKPALTPEMRTSTSVYYRKPGNASVVGSGTYGKVFKAVHVYTRQLVALKKLRMEGERDGFPVTAVREIKLLQSLRHENVVELKEVMVEKNDCFMVFEYLSHDLTGLLNHPSFKLGDAGKKDLARQMFQGLDYLHRRGVLHRDIKAANILVSSSGELKIADFGLARFYAKRKSLDYTNRVITIWYRSPELLLGETQYGPAVDVWSAACVLVEIFTRHAIFPGDGTELNQLDRIYNVLGTPTLREWKGLRDMQWFELVRPSVRRPSTFAEKYKERVSEEAFKLLVWLFNWDPAKRPTASEVLEHKYFTEEEPVAERPRLVGLEGDWHEFESKAARKEKEKNDKESKRERAREREREHKERQQSIEVGEVNEEKKSPVAGVKRAAEESAGGGRKRVHTEMAPPPAPGGEKERV